MFGRKCELKKRYVYDSKNSLTSSPASYTGRSGTLIVVATHGGKVIALDNKLAEVWRYTIKGSLADAEKFFIDEETSMAIQETPCLADLNNDGDPEVVFGADNGVLYCLDHRGKELWSFKTSHPIRTTPLVADINSDGRPEIVFGSRDGMLYVLDSDGKQLHSFKADSAIESSPALMTRSTDRCIVFGSENGTLYALSPNAQEVWQYATKGKIIAPPAVGCLYDGKPYVVVGAENGRLFAVTSHGSCAWSYQTGGAIVAKACLSDINKDGKLEIIFGSGDDRVYALSCSGTKLWSFHTNFWVGSQPIAIDINDDGYPEILVGSYDGKLYALDAKGKFLLNYLPGVAGFLQQTGHYTDVITSDVGTYEGSEICSLHIGGMITGAAYIESSIVVSTKDGFVSEVVFT
jgi:hypothetical protein